MINKKFIVLLGIGFLISSPFTYILVESWLQGFAYHIPVHLSAFVFAGLLVTIISIISVSIQALKAAVVNPAKSLNYE